MNFDEGRPASSEAFAASRYSTARFLQDEIEKFGWVIGGHSYGRPKVIHPAGGHLEIGRFCSIEQGVEIYISADRQPEQTETDATLKAFWPKMPAGFDDTRHEKSDVTIGSDVFIGAGSVISAGVTVGHGAYLTHGSHVEFDVPPYAIIGGKPARVMGYRHSPEVIVELLAIAWWDWDDETINARLPLMLTDVDGFIETYGA